MRILVLGGYGLIGSAIMRRLFAEGFNVAGLGRSVSAIRRTLPQADWIAADIAQLRSPESWLPHLGNLDAVVNAAGALQDGPDADLAALQDEAMRALYGRAARPALPASFRSPRWGLLRKRTPHS